MKRILFCLFLLMSFSTIYATNYNYTVDCITDSSGNIVESTDEIVSGGTYKIERKTFSNIDDNSDTTFCIGEYVSKILSENTVDITSTIKTETITSSYYKEASTDNLTITDCSSDHNHTGKNFDIPSNVTVSRIQVRYYSVRERGSNNATLYGSSDGKDWTVISTDLNRCGNSKYCSVGLYSDISTSYRYLRIYHSGGGIRGTVQGIYITGTIISGVQISDASFTVNDRIVKNITVTSSNTSWDTSGIDTSIWDVSTQKETLTLTAKNQSDINNVTSDQVVAAIKAVKWSSTTAPDPTVKITTLG